MSALAPVENGSQSPSTSAGVVRLNLGGQQTHIPGFKSVDINPEWNPDIVGDFLNLPVPDASIHEIYASHCFEHVQKTVAPLVLKEWRRVLVDGGKLWISVPDFDAMVNLYKKVGMTTWVEHVLYGDQSTPLDIHYRGFVFDTLAAELCNAGFSDLVRIDNLPYGVLDASKIVDSVNGIPISLNIEATA